MKGNVAKPPDGEAQRPESRLDWWVKFFGMLTPLLLAAVAGAYTVLKDASDKRNFEAQIVREEEAKRTQAQRDEDQRNWERKQKQYDNFSALVPLLTSEKISDVTTGLQIYAAEAADDIAPTSLQRFINDIQARHPQLLIATENALKAGQSQIDREQCRALPAGLYIHVANSIEQLQRGRKLANRLMSLGVAVQGVQRIDAGPSNTTLRWYWSSAVNGDAEKIIGALTDVGFAQPSRQDLTKQYLRPGCAAPPVYELWIGQNSPLPDNGTPR